MMRFIGKLNLALLLGHPILLSEASCGWGRHWVQPVVCITADENYFSNNVCVIDVSFITNQRTAASLHMKSATPVTDVVFRW